MIERQPATDRWDDVIGSANLTWYLQLGASHTIVTSGEYAGGWRVRAPFQLLLGMDEGGVRGYDDSPLGGAQRAVGRVESRWRLGQFGESAEYGILWRVDVAYPLMSDPRAGLEVRLSTSVATRFGWREPLDVRRSRQRTVPDGIFSWP